jgi:hypothetical protein
VIIISLSIDSFLQELFLINKRLDGGALKRTVDECVRLERLADYKIDQTQLLNGYSVQKTLGKSKRSSPKRTYVDGSPG